MKALELDCGSNGLSSMSDSDGASGIADRCGVSVHDLPCFPDCWGVLRLVVLKLILKLLTNLSPDPRMRVALM